MTVMTIFSFEEYLNQHGRAIIGTWDPHKIGDILPRAQTENGRGIMINLPPLLILRECTYEDFISQDIGLRQIPDRGYHYYEVTTD